MTMPSHFILRLPLIHLRSYRVELVMERSLTLLIGLYQSFSSRWWTWGLPMSLFWVIVVLKKKTYFQSKINFPKLSVHCKIKHIILHWFLIQFYLAMFGLQSGNFCYQFVIRFSVLEKQITNWWAKVPTVWIVEFLESLWAKNSLLSTPCLGSSCCDLAWYKTNTKLPIVSLLVGKTFIVESLQYLQQQQKKKKRLDDQHEGSKRVKIL